MTAADLSRWTTSAWRRARASHGWLDHLSRAVARYDSADGGRLSAAVTYYAFFATFAMALVGFAAFGFVLDDPAVQRSVQRHLTQNLPSLDIQAALTATGPAGGATDLAVQRRPPRATGDRPARSAVITAASRPHPVSQGRPHTRSPNDNPIPRS